MFQKLYRERQRSAAVHGLGILNTQAEPKFDRFVEAAAFAFDAPISLLSLICDDEQWFKAGHGLTLDCIPRNSGFCGFTVDQSDMLECCDQQRDQRFSSLPGVVGNPFVRYYIGTPLCRLNGIAVGALCVVDIKRRGPASADQKAFLVGLARQASLALEARSDLWGSAK